MSTETLKVCIILYTPPTKQDNRHQLGVMGRRHDENFITRDIVNGYISIRTPHCWVSQNQSSLNYRSTVTMASNTVLARIQVGPKAEAKSEVTAGAYTLYRGVTTSFLVE